MGLIMRRNIMAAKSGYTARDYVQDGLIAMFDGVENAGFNTHDESVRTWKNLAGGDDFILTSAASFDSNSLICDGSQYAGSAPAVQNAANTVEIVCNINRQQPRDRNLIFSACIDTFAPNAYAGVAVRDSDLIVRGNLYVDLLSSLFGVKLCVSTSIMRNIIFNDPVASMLRLTHSSYDATSERGSMMVVGGSLIEPARCIIHCIRVYGRYLGFDEIAVNHSVDKSRFGLT